jgi:hypothetical protein
MFFKHKPTFCQDAGLLSIATGLPDGKMSVFCQKTRRISAREARRWRKSSGWRWLDPSSSGEQASRVPWDVRAFQSPFHPCLKQVGTPGTPLGSGGNKRSRKIPIKATSQENSVSAHFGTLTQRSVHQRSVHPTA